MFTSTTEMEGQILQLDACSDMLAIYLGFVCVLIYCIDMLGEVYVRPAAIRSQLSRGKLLLQVQVLMLM